MTTKSTTELIEYYLGLVAKNISKKEAGQPAKHHALRNHMESVEYYSKMPEMEFFIE